MLSILDKVRSCGTPFMWFLLTIFHHVAGAECIVPLLPQGPHYVEQRRTALPWRGPLVPMTAQGIMGLPGGHNNKSPLTLQEAQLLEPACVLIFANGGTMSQHGMWHDLIFTHA